MKTLNLKQMESIHGGRGCGTIGAIFGVAGMVLTVAALATNPLTLAGGLILAHSISFSIVGGGCGLAEIL